MNSDLTGVAGLSECRLPREGRPGSCHEGEVVAGARPAMLKNGRVGACRRGADSLTLGASNSADVEFFFRDQNEAFRDNDFERAIEGLVAGTPDPAPFSFASSLSFPFTSTGAPKVSHEAALRERPRDRLRKLSPAGDDGACRSILCALFGLLSKCEPP